MMMLTHTLVGKVIDPFKVKYLKCAGSLDEKALG
jgi:hypothetical protein